jgi:hypothetical protein
MSGRCVQVLSPAVGDDIPLVKRPVTIIYLTIIVVRIPFQSPSQAKSKALLGTVSTTLFKPTFPEYASLAKVGSVLLCWYLGH